MINNVKKIIKRVIGKVDYLSPISDVYQYKRNMESFSGNSISDSNILIVTNLDGQSQDSKVIASGISVENGINTFLIVPECNISKNSIIKSGDNLIGPYDHVINIISFKNCFEFEQNSFIKPVSIEQIYKLIQVEADYMIEKVKYGTICTAVIYNNLVDIKYIAEIEGIRSLISGLGIVMPNHNIILNGVISSEKVPMSKIVNALVYLSGKYGQVLDGEVLLMDE